MTLEALEKRYGPALGRSVSESEVFGLDVFLQSVLLQLRVANLQIAMLKLELERGKLMAEEIKEHKQLSIDEMMAAPDTRFHTEFVPEWGGSVKFGSIDAGSMIDFVGDGQDDNRSSMLSLLVRSLINPDGSRIPKEDIERRVEDFKKKDVTVVNRLLDVALDLNGVRVKKVELKNVLGEAQIAASPTA